MNKCIIGGFNRPTALAANSSSYYGIGSSSGATGAIAVPVPGAGIVEALYARANAAAGAGETFTYTLYVNGIITAQTCQTGGAVATDSNDEAHPIAVAAGDNVAIRIQTSLNAAVVWHVCSLRLRLF